MTETAKAATGQHTTNGTPHGYTSLTPFIVVPRAGEAIKFYADVFGARTLGVTEMGGVVVHAELDFGAGRLQLGEPNPAFHLVAPPQPDDVCYSLALYCPDADAVVAKAEAAGAVVREPLMTFVSGDRFASVLDQFGVRWSIMTRVEDLSEDESCDRVAKWSAEQA